MAKKKLNPIPRGYPTVSTLMNLNDSSSTIAFARKVFGAKLGRKLPGPNGKLLHAELHIGNSLLMLSDVMKEPVRNASFHLYVKNVDATFKKAVLAGAKIVNAPENMFWGERFARLEDAQGNRWVIAARVEQVSPAEMKKRMAAFSAG